ncbi:hypothetical protein [Bdellovibrio sp. HCB337]|uniref:hypothetical protein n=1 Tax=Bdellovibrio sp. HCB337 TaxID=3394358 RepID=UPI0039A4D97E
MERMLSPILALGLFFGTLTVQAAPGGSPQDFNLRTKYSCQANGVVVRNNKTVVSNGQGIDEVDFMARAGGNQALTFGRNREHMIWPRTAKGTFNKTLNVLSRDSSGTYKLMQELDLGATQKTTTRISLVAKDAQGDDRPVNCQIEMQWVKKTK